ncbi:hypothetical protein QEZ48_09300 [Aquamicrobium lusatiense]|nr:hypothetical protein [Aquamicrobium lusatiense]MDH4991025.1 hypothetical protein [Aquamicrobium lusatiense]
MKPIALAFFAASALSASACTTSQQVAASSVRLNDSARRIVGTSLVGARGATSADQDKIYDTVAGLCAAKTWTPGECLRHDQAAQR